LSILSTIFLDKNYPSPKHFFSLYLAMRLKLNAIYNPDCACPQGPIEAVVGLLFGTFWGLLAIYLPGKDDSSKSFGRLFILLGGALLAMFGSSAKGVELPGSGALVSFLCSNYGITFLLLSFNYEFLSAFEMRVQQRHILKLMQLFFQSSF
jgi:hypothetical protein